MRKRKSYKECNAAPYLYTQSMDVPTYDRTVVEYFAGIGLVRMGLEACGWKVVFANDISDKKYEMYQSFFPDAADHYVVNDIFNIPANAIPSSVLATCSFPCIDLSIAGNMGGINGKHSSAFWGFVKILKEQHETRPPLVLVENVPGWLYSDKGRDFRTTVQALNDIGYFCDVFSLDALRFTPQSRPRVFLVGTLSCCEDKQAESILERPQSLLSTQLKKCILSNRDLKWFYNEIPEPPPLRKNGLAEIIEDIDDTDIRWWPDHKVMRHLTMMTDAHYSRVMDLKNASTISYRTFFRRRRRDCQRAEVRDDDIAGCLRTAIGGSGKQFLIKAGRGRLRMRALTPREYARLQGVPDIFQITTREVQALTGFGDAVCVPAITWIAKNILNPLESGTLTEQMALHK